MRAILALLLSLLAAPAVALDQSAIPARFPIPWGNSAGSAYIRVIPQASQIGIQNCAASLTDGFPPLTFVPASAGGCPPFGQDMNGILKQITQWLQWQAAGSPVVWNASFSASIVGYPKGAVLASTATAGCTWTSIVDGNTTNPDSGGANWVQACASSGSAGSSTGTANAQIVAASPFVLQTGSTVSFVAGFTNTAALQVNINGAGLSTVFRRSQLGATSSVGGEVIAGQIVVLQWDGTRWQVMSAPIVTVGEMKDFTSATAPPGWAFVDGRCAAQAGQFADLYAVVGTNFGACGAGNFNFPDGRGRIFFALDNQGTTGSANRMSSFCASSTLGAQCGNQGSVINQNNLASGITFPNNLAILNNTTSGTNTVSGIVGGPLGSSNQFATMTSGTAGGGQALTITGSVTAGGSDVPMSTIQPGQFATKIIKY